ncbi:porin [Geobacter sp. DSM 9736]|uniref:porin n=1 Tax=Geobacter sp. DSM 9736 TaxID=1277350 RepID=UPI000B510033|nr:porin [Geobacter sp. DSM 9736]SNB47335.1 hypothetical protein SAMN06269301_2814 [Geobacter sp. DSM 9736]
MSMKKKLVVAAACTALTAGAAVPAMALENEFHGMYRFFGYQTNVFNGLQANLSRDAHSGFFAEQRARLQYIAKANDNLKLVTHFELDSRFGGKVATAPGNGYLGANDDAGNLDADQLTLETKNVYLDFNTFDTNFKVGIQPWNDSYKSLFLLADMTGVAVTKKFDPITASVAWYRFDDNTVAGTADPGRDTADLIVLDGKFAVSKDLILGANYYNVQNDSGLTAFELLHMFGANASMKLGPAAVDVFAAYQTGEFNATQDLKAYMFGTTGKVKVGPGAVNFAGFYLSGDGTTGAGTGDRGDFQTISNNTTYFNPANMWLLIRSGQAINSSTSVLGNDMTVGDRGMWGAFVGYEGKVDKMFYNANLGYAEAAHARNANEKKSLGTEANLQVGYNIYDNLQVSVAGAYLLLGDGLGGKANEILAGSGAVDADNPYMANVQLSYTF